MKGRKPKPTNLKVLEGNPGKRPLNESEPQPDPTIPDCPEWLHEDARVEWERITPELHRLGLLTSIDRAALAGYCESWAQYKQAIEFLHRHGPVYPIKTDAGEVKYLQQVPQVGIANKALANIRSLCAEFGLTPSSRARISLPNETENEDPMAQVLRRR